MDWNRISCPYQKWRRQQSVNCSMRIGDWYEYRRWYWGANRVTGKPGMNEMHLVLSFPNVGQLNLQLNTSVWKCMLVGYPNHRKYTYSSGLAFCLYKVGGWVHMTSDMSSGTPWGLPFKWCSWQWTLQRSSCCWPVCCWQGVFTQTLLDVME